MHCTWLKFSQVGAQLGLERVRITGPIRFSGIDDEPGTESVPGFAIADWQNQTNLW